MKVRKKKKYILLILLCCAICAVAAGCDKTQEDGLVSLSEEWSEKESGQAETPADLSEQKGVSEDYSSEQTDTPQELLFVYVCGAVSHPGVYQLPLDSRIYEAIDAAGGLREDAAGESINQAQKVEDGQQIYVPTVEEAEQNAGAWTQQSFPAEGLGTSSKVNINSAGVEDLKTLPGIGDTKAQSIVSYRQQNGMFQSIEELMNVEGIKNGVFDKIKDRITV